MSASRRLRHAVDGEAASGLSSLAACARRAVPKGGGSAAGKFTQPMVRYQAEPAPLLRPYVHSYWGFARDLSQMRDFAVTPDCFSEVIFFDDPPFVRDGDGLRRLSACTLIPLLDEPLHLVLDGFVRCAAVRFHAGATGVLLPRQSARSERWYDVSAAFADAMPVVVRALQCAAWADVTAAFDAALLRIVAQATPAAPALRAVRTFVQPPDGTTGAATEDVAARHGRSRRQIERRVRSLTNRSPKQLVCLRRFQFVRDALWTRPEAELDGLALEAGYADQAHLSRHFRRYAEQSPMAYKRDCKRLEALLRTQDVAVVQDDAYEDG